MSLDTVQAAAIEKMSRLRAGALFMKMGTGKTRTAIKIAEGRQRDFDVLVWIAPASLLRDADYLAEIDKWSGALLTPIAFYSVEGISLSDTKYLELRALAESRRCFCVVDESLDIKNAEAGRTRRLLEMRALFEFRLILNGTPLSKGLIDLYAQIEFISPNILKMTEAQFANNFLQYKKDGYRPWMRWSKPENEAALIEMIRPYIFDADLDIPVDLDPRDVRLKLSNLEAADYDDFKKAFLRDNVSPSFLSVVQAFQHRYTLAGSKLKHIKATIPRDRKSIIFVKFLKEIEALKEILPDSVVMSGPQKDDLQRFKRDAPFLISTYGTGSRGLNLQHASNVVFFSQTFDWAHKEHGLHRAYRTGQQRDVTVTNYRLDTGLEVIMQKSEEKKENTAANVKRFIEQRGAESL